MPVPVPVHVPVPVSYPDAMSEPQSRCEFRFAYNSLLLVTSGMTVSQMMPSCHPFACGACVVGGAVAVLGLLRVLFARKPDEMRVVRDVNRGLLELLPLPLVNMELYRRTQGTLSPLVWGHCIILFPLMFDLNCSINHEHTNCNLTDTLRDLTMLGNIISLGYLAYREANSIYLRMTLSMFLVKYTPVLLDYVNDGTGEDMIVCCSAYFFYQLSKVTALVEE